MIGFMEKNKDDDDDDDDEEPLHSSKLVLDVQCLENEFHDNCSWKRLGRIHILHLL
jgi:hypothetical protein